MADTTVLGLLQFVGLSLPAIAIYLQILRQSHTRYIEAWERERDETDEYSDYQFARTAALFMVLGGLLLIAYLLTVQPPNLLDPYTGSILLLTLKIAAITSVGLGLISLLLSILVVKWLKPGYQSLSGNYKFFLEEYTSLSKDSEENSD